MKISLIKGFFYWSRTSSSCLCELTVLGSNLGGLVTHFEAELPWGWGQAIADNDVVSWWRAMRTPWWQPWRWWWRWWRWNNFMIILTVQADSDVGLARTMWWQRKRSWNISPPMSTNQRRMAFCIFRFISFLQDDNMIILTYCIRTYMDVSENSGTPKSSILVGFSIINHPFWGTPIFGNTHIIFSSLPLLPPCCWTFGG